MEAALRLIFILAVLNCVKDTLQNDSNQSRSSPGDGGQSDPERSMTKLSKRHGGTSAASIDDSYVLVPLKKFANKPLPQLAGNKDQNDYLVLLPFDGGTQRRKRRLADLRVKAVREGSRAFNHTRSTKFRKKRRINYAPYYLQHLNRLSASSVEENPAAENNAKRKKSLKVNDLATQFDDATGIENIPKITMESDDVGPKKYHRQNLVSKHRKKNDPVNITMHISNLIPANEVDNTRITNSGKLYKNGCLKFSIQLEKPGAGCVEDNTCPCGCDSTSYVSSMQNKAGDGVNNSLSGAALPSGGTDKSNRGNLRPGKASDSARPPQLGDSERNDLGAVLLQLMASMTEKSHHHTNKKLPQPQSHPSQAQHPQAVLMDSDIVRELQKLLISPQAAEGVAQDGPRLKSQTRTSTNQQNSKAQAIAQLLKHFSKVAPADRRDGIHNK